MSRSASLLLTVMLLAAPAAAQHAGPHGQPGHAQVPGASRTEASGSYAGLQARRVKALSEMQEADLRAGRGMALALAAELNGYPGPMHVLEFGEALRLTAAQAAIAQALRARMGAEARTLGARVVALEEELDALFRDGEADTGRLGALTSAIGALNGRLREVHLAAHIEMRAALEPWQRDAYARLRGHGADR